jgi:NADH dehydrogenase
MTELHEVAGSRTDPEAVQVSFAKIFAGTDVELIVDEVKTIDFHNNKLISDVAEYPYDYLVVGAGGEPEFFDIPGVQENCFTCWSLEDAIRIRTHVEECFREAAKEPDPARRRRLLTFTIAGGGFTGAELAGELLDQRDVLCPKYHISEEEVRVLVVEMMDSILPIFPEHLRRKASRYLRRRGAEIMLNSPITSAEEGRITIADEEHVQTETFIWTAGIHGSEFTSKIELTKGQCARGEQAEASIEGIHGMAGCHFEEDERYIVGERGRIQVNKYMQSVDFDNVYLVGDMIWFIENERPVPQIVETALQTAEVASENVAAEVEGKKKKKEFKSNYHGFMVSLGSRYGVAHVMGISLSGFFAMASKHLINVHYLFGLAGINAVWEYLQHEFFHVKDQRSFVGEHLGWRVPVYWTVPLRLWLGGKWLAEGIKKLQEGWLNPGEGGLAAVSGSAVRMPGVSFGDGADGGSSASPSGGEGSGDWSGSGGESGQQADGGSSASPSGGSGNGESWNQGGNGGGEAAGQAADTASSASPAAGSGQAAAEGAQSGSEYGEPLMEAWGIYNWFAETFLSLSPLLAFLLQSAVVLAEVVIGLALIGGAFTFLAAGASILLGVMFLASGWGNPELLWYFFASLVMLGGAGRGFGLDHYIMPALHRWWNRRKVAHKTYLYTGEPRFKN